MIEAFVILFCSFVIFAILLLSQRQRISLWLNPSVEVHKLSALKKNEMGLDVVTQQLYKSIYDNYVQQFLCCPHPLLGRPGSVCPFVPKAIQLDSVYFSLLRGKEEKEITRKCMGLKDRFQTLEPSTGPLSMFKALIIILPSVSGKFVDSLQHSMKEEFVKNALMIGEFHSENNTPALNNSTFFPLRTVIPCLAIRHMVPGDLQFMTMQNYSTKLKVSLLQAFISHYSTRNQDATAKAQVLLSQLTCYQE